MSSLELEIFYIKDLPQFTSILGGKDLEWSSGKVCLTQTEIWLPSDDGWSIIPLASIEMVGRQISSSFSDKIRMSAKFSSNLVVDYRKKAGFGLGHVTSTIVFAGNGDDIRTVKNFLTSILDFAIDSDDGELDKDQSQLLFLLAEGGDERTRIISLFKGNEILLDHALSVLRKKGLVNDDGSLSQHGVDYVRGIGPRQDPEESGGILSQRSSSNHGHDLLKAGNGVNKVVWRCGESFFSGRVLTKDIWQCLHPFSIEGMDIEMLDDSVRLKIRDSKGSLIYIESKDIPTISAICVALDGAQDMHIRILCLLYLEINDPDALSRFLGVHSFILYSHLKQMAGTGLIGQDYDLMDIGMDMINKIIGSGMEGYMQEDNVSEDDDMQDPGTRLLEKLGVFV